MVMASLDHIISQEPSSLTTEPQSPVFMESMEPVKDESSSPNKKKPKKTVRTTKFENPLPVSPNNNGDRSNPTLRRKRTRTRTNSFGVPPKSAAMELAGGMFVYLFCVSLPAMMGVIVRLYQNTFLLDGDNDNSARQRTTTSLPAMNISQNILKVLQRWTGVYLQTNALSDVQFVALVSITLAVFRIFLIYVLVPRGLVPKRVEALVRCKSTHMLSAAEYRFDNELESTDNGMVSSPRRFSGSSFYALTEGAPAIPSFDDDNNNNPRPKRTRLRRVYSLLSNAFRLSMGITKASTTPLDAKQTRNLRSAPRYATAVFRFCCCALSTIWCILNFHSANFWPLWVGGIATAHTKNCWDLSGSVADLKGDELFDSDFDHQNSRLRYFFLTHAAYQLHSLCFHTISMVLLALYGGKKGILVSVRSSVKSYFMTIMEHLLGISLITGASLFSGVRRLGAIAIFALEASSLVLQLLQICINAPEGSRLRRPQTIRIVHRYMTIPIFVYCRLFVVPFIVLYSSLFESRDWIRQIERAMAPGCGALLYYFFNGLLIVVVGLNLVFLRRLLFHPHVRQILSTNNLHIS